MQLIIRLTGAKILCDPLFQDVARSRLKVGQGGLRRGVLAFKYIHCNVLVKIYETNGTFRSQYIFNFRGCVELWLDKDTELWHVHLESQSCTWMVHTHIFTFQNLCIFYARDNFGMGDVDGTVTRVQEWLSLQMRGSPGSQGPTKPQCCTSCTTPRESCERNAVVF